jgi:hypothetical protein
LLYLKPKYTIPLIEAGPIGLRFKTVPDTISASPFLFAGISHEQSRKKPQ